MESTYSILAKTDIINLRNSLLLSVLLHSHLWRTWWSTTKNYPREKETVTQEFGIFKKVSKPASLWRTENKQGV